MDDIILTVVTLIVLFGSLFGGIGVLSHFLQYGFVLPDTLGTVLCFYIVAVLLALCVSRTLTRAPRKSPTQSATPR